MPSPDLRAGKLEGHAGKLAGCQTIVGLGVGLVAVRETKVARCEGYFARQESKLALREG